MKSLKSTAHNSRQILLKNGYIVDGTGHPGKTGNLLINGRVIQCISRENIDVSGEVIDCSGKVIAPGFIDIHSHNDWLLPSDNMEKFTAPFIRQGITTFVGGNCGLSAAGFYRKSRYKSLIGEYLFKGNNGGLVWDDMDEYFNFLMNKGISNNLSMLVGHGTVRASMKGIEPSSLDKDDMDKLIHIIEQSMEQGAKGVSLGLQYQPGIFASCNELMEVAKAAGRRGKILTVHARALSSFSGSYPARFIMKPHNVIAVEEMINLARETGVSLQFSHLIFVGRRTWDTVERILEMFDKAIDEGIDIKFDTYAYSCGGSIISVILPKWFIAGMPGIFDDRHAMLRLKIDIDLAARLIGFDFSDIQIAYACHPDLDRYNGMFLDEIAKIRNMSQFDNYIDFVKKSGGKARVIMHKYSNEKIVETLMKHRASIFITDAWVENEGTQNPAAYGCFPRFLELSRKKGILSLEETVYKMTGACAERMNIKGRGVLKEGMAADITIFDWNKIKDNTTVRETDKTPSGIEHVFINGNHVLDNGKIASPLNCGQILK